MRSWRRLLLLVYVLLTPFCFAQSGEEIPIQRCDVLPYVIVKVAGKDMHLLLDTAATSILNVKSFIGVTIDLQRRVATLKGIDATVRDQFNDMEKSMARCTDAFNLGHADELMECLDPEIVFYTPQGEFRGRQQVMEYLQRTYLKFAPNLHYQRNVHDVRSVGDALWYSYDYTLEMPGHAVAGHGMAMCQR